MIRVRPPGVAEDALGRLAQAAEGVERVRVVGREEGPRGPGVAEAAADEHLGEHRRDAEVRGQALGGAAVVGRDGERDVRLEHRRSVCGSAGGIAVGAILPADPWEFRPLDRRLGAKRP